jgi:hypothetical protein
MKQIIWQQPIRTFAAWRAQGIDTLWGYVPDNATLDDYLGAAKQSGLSVLLQREYLRPQDSVNPTVVGTINTPDECDGAGNVLSPVMRQQYADIKAKAPSLPVYINFDGHRFPYVQAAEYIDYCKAGDVLAFDFYPLNATGNPDNIHLLGDFVKDLKVWGNGKPVIAFIETDNQDLSQADYVKGTPLEKTMRGPKPDEFELEIRTVVSAGVDGLAFFPDDVGKGWISFNHDDPEIDKRWTALQPFIHGSNTPTPIVKPTKEIASTIYIYKDGTVGVG